MVDERINEVVLERIAPVIEFALTQTHQQNRDDLRQHLFEVVLKTLNNTEFSKPKGIFA